MEHARREPEEHGIDGGSARGKALLAAQETPDKAYEPHETTFACARNGCPARLTIAASRSRGPGARRRPHS